MIRALALAAFGALLGAAARDARADNPIGPALGAGDSRPVAPAPARVDGPTEADAVAIARLSMRAASRHFSYVDRITPALRPYDLSAAPMTAVDVDVFPLARSRIPALEGFGVTGSFARAFALSSVDAGGGARVSTDWQSYEIGARERIPASRTVLFGLRVAYGADDFTFGGGLPANAALPGVGYRYARFGGDARVSFGSFAVFGQASYLDVFSLGALSALFPRPAVGGVEARVGAAYLFGRHFELSAELAYRRMFFSIHPEPGDTNVAGGALDEMAFASLGIGYLL